MKRRILASILLTTSAAVLLFAVPLALAAARLFKSEEETRLAREATRAAEAVPVTGLRGADPVQLPRPSSASIRLAMYDGTGAIVVGHGPNRGGRLVARALTGRITGEQDGSVLAVGVPITDEDQVVGAAQATVPVSVVRDRVWRWWAAMAALAAIVIAIASAVARKQSQRLTQPIGDLVTAAERLGEGDFSVRPEPHGIPELDIAGSALGATATRLGTILERERAFSANASHQLSTPVTGLRLLLESAVATPGTDLRQTIDEALGEVDRLQATLDDMLTLARDTSAPRQATDISAVVAALAEEWHPRLAAKNRALRVHGTDTARWVAGAPAAIRQILAVLLDNADAHGAGSVTITVRSVGAGTIVSVADEGPGITGDREALFARRSPASRGHGIGLSLARSLAEAEGGRLRVRRTAPNPEFVLVLTNRSIAAEAAPANG